MKRLITGMVSAALVGSAMIATPVASVSAQSGNDGNSDIAALCQDWEGFGFDSIGHCVSTIRNGPQRLCQRLKDADRYPIFVWKNQGDCVSWWRERQNR